MLPGHRGDAGNVRHVLGGLLARQQLRQDGHIVVDYAVGDQPATLMPQMLVIIEQIEAANDIVVFPQSLARLVFSSIGVEFVDNDTRRSWFLTPTSEQRWHY